jgi:hypothetical protein
MDVKKSETKQSKSLSTKLLVFTVLGLIAALIVDVTFNTDGASVKRSELLISSVKKDDVRVSIEGYGSLRSDRQLLINSLTNATVKEIVLKPGALVTLESVIVQLSNPVLQQELQRERQALAQSNANLRQLKLSQNLELLNENSNYEEMVALYETAKAKLDAQRILINSGIVSTLDYKESQIQELQLRKRLEIHKKKIEAWELINQEAINIQIEQIKQQQGRLEVAQERVPTYG